MPTNDTEILAKQGDDYLESYSKYNELDIADDAEDEVNVLNPYGAYKPNLVATGNYFWNESIANGTSYAAPQVTGVIAQLCSYDSTLKTKQSSMGAILMASCGRKLAAEVQSGTEIISSGSFKGGDFIASVSMNQSDNQISNKQGAGKLDAYWAYTIVRDDIYWSLTLNSSITSYTKDVYITKSTNTLTRVAIFWLMKKTPAESSTGHIYYPLPEGWNWNLRVFDPNGQEIDASLTTHNNYEIVQFVPPVSGTYRITIERSASSSNLLSYVGLAVW